MKFWSYKEWFRVFKVYLVILSEPIIIIIFVPGFSAGQT